MKLKLLSNAISTILLVANTSVFAGEVNGLIDFTSGTPARASEVNGNFQATKTAVDDNHARVSALETIDAATRLNMLEGINAGQRITALEGLNIQNRLGYLETYAENPDIAGNITLQPSEAQNGNIMKGSASFLHNFGFGNTFLGESAGNFTLQGNFNTATGINALTGLTTGANNSAFGTNALTNNTQGTENTAVGFGALLSNTTGSSNTAVGSNTLRDSTDGQYNTAVGYEALRSNTTALGNTAMGATAMVYNTTGENNTAIGVNALFANTSGSNNIAIGNFAGSAYTIGDNNIAIGHTGVADESSTIRVGNSQTRTFIAGIRGITTDISNALPVLIDGNGQLGTINSSRRTKDNIHDMGDASNILMQLRPVTFNYKSNSKVENPALQYGLIAEEVAEIAPQLVAHANDGRIETVYYQHLAPMLLNEYQKQAREITELREQIARMNKLISQLQVSSHVAAATINQ